MASNGATDAGRTVTADGEPEYVLDGFEVVVSVKVGLTPLMKPSAVPTKSDRRRT